MTTSHKCNELYEVEVSTLDIKEANNVAAKNNLPTHNSQKIKESEQKL